MYKNKKILAVVPARGGSKGIKNKNLRKINNISLVGHVGLILKKIPYVDYKVVSTDSNKIQKEALKYDLNAPFLRPKKISGDRIGDVDVLNHALINSEKFYKKKFDYIMMLQPTSPVRDYKLITKMIRKIIDKGYNAIWSVSICDLKFHPYKQLIIRNNKLSYYDKKNAKNIIARQQLTSTLIRNGICYIYSRNLIKNKKIIDNNSGFEIINHEYANIDTIDDIKKAKNLMSKIL